MPPQPHLSPFRLVHRTNRDPAAAGRYIEASAVENETEVPFPVIWCQAVRAGRSIRSKAEFKADDDDDGEEEGCCPAIGVRSVRIEEDQLVYPGEDARGGGKGWKLFFVGKGAALAPGCLFLRFVLIPRASAGLTFLAEEAGFGHCLTLRDGGVLEGLGELFGMLEAGEREGGRGGTAMVDTHFHVGLAVPRIEDPAFRVAAAVATVREAETEADWRKKAADGISACIFDLAAECLEDVSRLHRTAAVGANAAGNVNGIRGVNGGEEEDRHPLSLGDLSRRVDDMTRILEKIVLFMSMAESTRAGMMDPRPEASVLPHRHDNIIPRRLSELIEARGNGCSGPDVAIDSGGSGSGSTDGDVRNVGNAVMGCEELRSDDDSEGSKITRVLSFSEICDDDSGLTKKEEEDGIDADMLTIDRILSDDATFPTSFYPAPEEALNEGGIVVSISKATALPAARFEYRSPSHFHRPPRLVVRRSRRSNIPTFRTPPGFSSSSVTVGRGRRKTGASAVVSEFCRCDIGSRAGAGAAGSAHIVGAKYDVVASTAMGNEHGKTRQFIISPTVFGRDKKVMIRKLLCSLEGLG